MFLLIFILTLGGRVPYSGSPILVVGLGGCTLWCGGTHFGVASPVGEGPGAGAGGGGPAAGGRDGPG